MAVMVNSVGFPRPGPYGSSDVLPARLLLQSFNRVVSEGKSGESQRSLAAELEDKNPLLKEEKDEDEALTSPFFLKLLWNFISRPTSLT